MGEKGENAAPRRDSAPEHSPFTLRDLEDATGRSARELSHAALWSDRDHERRLLRVGAKSRVLHVSKPRLRAIQDSLLPAIVARLTLPGYVFGVKGRGPRDNAHAHQGNTHVQLLDIRAAFPSVSYLQVDVALERLGFERHVARLATRLCTANGCLPQGAPTSSALLNAVLSPIDTALAIEVGKLGFRYTRYVDDITISGVNPCDTFIPTVSASLRSIGLELNLDKIARWQPNVFACVTGVVLAGSLRPERPFLQNLSREVRRFVRGDSSYTFAQLAGRIAWVEALNPKMGAEFTHRITRSRTFRRAAGRIGR